MIRKSEKVGKEQSGEGEKNKRKNNEQMRLSGAMISLDFTLPNAQ